MNAKITRLLVPAALVFAGIVVNSFFDPLGGLLVPKKKTLQQTPVMIETIRGIGQLITAEYAGEVISTLQEQKINEKIVELSVDTMDFSHQDTKTQSKNRSHQSESIEKFRKSRAFRKRQLIAVGRGRVRAGIDFSAFTEKNFRYLADKKRIYLYGLAPEILYCDINPWFIPEKKIPGFEIIAATRQACLTKLFQRSQANNADDLLRVKSGCLRRLRGQAVKNGIVELARSNAEETLKEWFSILMEVRIEGVVIVE